MQRFLARVTFGTSPRIESDEPPALQSAGLQLFFRGYIANRRALAAEAQQRGHNATSLSQAELFALAYVWWGAALPQHLVGEYAVAIYDTTKQVLLLAHDELGLVPLFYSESQDGIYFASFLEDLVEELGSSDLDEEYIADYIGTGQHFGERTPYLRLRRVLPGQSLRWDGQRLNRHSTWTLINTGSIRYRDDRSYDHHFREMVREGVASAIPPRGKVWCELSGGLDSSTVLAIAAGGATHRLEAISFVYPRSHTADESRWMRVVLEKYPIPWHTIDGDSVRPFTELPKGFIAEPNASLVSYGVNRVYAELRQKHYVRTVITGHGGDAAFFGDAPAPYFFADLLRTGSFRQLWNQLYSWQHNVGNKRPATYWLARYALTPAWRHLRKGLIQDHAYRTERIPWLTPHFSHVRNVLYRGRKSFVPQVDSVGNSDFFERILGVANLVSNQYYHRRVVSEFRHPLLYRPLLEFMLALPWDQKLSPRCDRVLQRRALAGILPEATLRRTDKSGSDQAFFEGLESGLDWFQLLTDQPRLVERGYADRDAWHQAVLQAQVGRTVGIKYFLASATLEAWLRQLEIPRATKRLPA